MKIFSSFACLGYISPAFLCKYKLIYSGFCSFTSSISHVLESPHSFIFVILFLLTVQFAFIRRSLSLRTVSAPPLQFFYIFSTFTPLSETNKISLGIFSRSLAVLVSTEKSSNCDYSRQSYGLPLLSPLPLPFIMGFIMPKVQDYHRFQYILICSPTK